MLTKRITAAALAASLICVPVSRATADTKDIIIGAIVGGAVIAGVTAAQKRKRQREQAQQQILHQTPKISTRSKPRVSRPSIPATQEGREVQSALNYFGFSAGSVDGRIGRRTKSAISGYQTYMGYSATGTLSSFEQHVLTQTYLRAEAGGQQTFRDIAAQPDGPRGLLKLYRAELASGGPSTQPLHRSAIIEPAGTIVDL